MSGKRFYRVGNVKTEQGLWYDFEGNFTGLIHNEFNFCMNNKLQMPFDENIVGWLSAVDELNDLFNWFSREDLCKLKEFGYEVLLYVAKDYKIHQNHWVIKQDSSHLISGIVIDYETYKR